jgi:mRNA-degrading endonuclease toxin of MazEF toxin-antitoxin module
MPGKCVRGDVVEINLDPAIGSEPNKTRLCVVVQNDTGNRYSPVIIVVIVTGAEHVPKRYPVDVPVEKSDGGLSQDSVEQCNLSGASMNAAWSGRSGAFRTRPCGRSMRR